MKLAMLALLLTSCSFELPSDTIRPIDEYCMPGQCLDSQMCHDGTCYDKCKSGSDCETGCCWPDAERTALYCAPEEVCE
jgi:hypothetical protein